MKTYIQDPQWPDSTYLLEQILGACEGASSGVGAFAFASASGANLLLWDPEFTRFLSKSRFDLVVGVDAITDTEALAAISACAKEYPNLTPRAFMSSLHGSVFHPKMCWFSRLPRGLCLVGSSNLTSGGLRGNCEAFSMAGLTNGQLRILEETWRSWCLFHASNLLPFNDPRVRQRAKENGISNRAKPKSPHDILVEDAKGNITVAPPKTNQAAVLIAEIPRGGDRWNQANFDLDTFSSFFGATPGHTQRIILTHVNASGLAGPQEVRPSVAVKSHNYRFELEAAGHLRYPVHGRPIAIFVKVAIRTFRYRLLMPGTRSHRQANGYLRQHCPQNTNRVRRLLTNVAAVNGELFFKGLAN